jgi:hypothetical protein
MRLALLACLVGQAQPFYPLKQYALLSEKPQKPWGLFYQKHHNQIKKNPSFSTRVFQVNSV